MRFLRAATVVAISGSLILAGGTPAWAADDTAPVIVDSGLPANGLVALWPRIVSTVSDDVGVVRVEVWAEGRLFDSTQDGSWTTTTLWPNLSSVSGSTVDLTVRAYDAAGNVGSATVEGLVIDSDLPTATFSPRIGAGAPLRGEATITLTDVSPDVVAAKLVSFNTRRELGRFAGSPLTLVWNTVGQDDDPFIVLTDRAGNEAHHRTGYRVDNQAPPIANLLWKRTVGGGVFGAPPPFAGGTGRFEVVAVPADKTGTSRYEFRVDGKLISADGSWNTGAVDRTVTVEVKAWDGAGNTSSRTFNVIVDNTAPRITSVTPANGKLIRGRKLTSAVTATDESGLWMTQLAGADVDAVAPYRSTIAAGRDGKKTLTWTVTDRAGNRSVARRVVTVDNTKPKLKVTKAPKNKAKVKGTVKITASASDRNGVARVELLVNGKVVAKDTKAAYKFSLNTRKYGKKIKVQLRAYDKAGNVTTTSTRTWRR
jgi:predicted secreted protein